MSHATDLFPRNNNTDTIPHEREALLSEDDVNRVKEIENISVDRSYRCTTLFKQVFTMDNGTRYPVVSSQIPDNRQKDSSDILSTETTALSTRPDGMYIRRLQALARLSISGLVVGVQQNLTQWGDLTQSAHDEIEIAKVVAETQGYDLETILPGGVSRGGMSGIIKASISKQHGIDVPYVDAIVPCFPQGLNIFEDLLAYRSIVMNEARAVKTAGSIPFSVLTHLPKTFDFSTRGLFQQLKEIPTLLSGAVGEQVKEHMSPDMFGYVLAFEGDIMSQGRRWEAMFNDEDYPNMNVAHNPGGGHASCIFEESHRQWNSRMQTVIEIIHENPKTRHIGGTALRDLAAKRNPVFNRVSPENSTVLRGMQASA